MPGASSLYKWITDVGTEEHMGLKDDFKKTSHTLVEAAEKKGKEIKAAASKAGKEVENVARRAIEKAKHAATGLRKP